MNSEFRDLLSLFNDHEVRYLVVGGYAVIRDESSLEERPDPRGEPLQHSR